MKVFLSDKCNKNKKAAFTLAEILIVLAILGVVATIVLSTTVKNYKKRLTVTRLQKAYYDINKMANNIVESSGCVGQNVTCTGLIRHDTSKNTYDNRKTITSEFYNMAGFNNANIESRRFISIYPLTYEKDNNMEPYQSHFDVISPNHKQYEILLSYNDTGFVNPCNNVAQEKVYYAIYM